MSRRRCCCGCRVFYDRFDRGGPTQVIGDPWDDVNATGEWWIDGSTQAKYPADSALYEVTGSGEIIGPSAPDGQGWSASYDIIDELPHNVYRIIFGAAEDAGRPGLPPLPGADCIIAEFYIGDYDATQEYSEIRIYTRSGGVETLVKKKAFPCPAVNFQNGRRFHAHWLNTHGDNTFCAWVSHSAYPSLVVATGVSPPGNYFGAANASGSADLPIEIDDYEIEKAAWETVDGEQVPCFACTCVCYDYPNDNYETTPTDRALYPGVLTLRITGSCCEPFMTPCDTTGCPSTDETIQLEYENDYPMVGFNGWYNHVRFFLCGYEFQFRAECDATGFLTLSIYWKPVPDLGLDWADFVQGGAISLTRQSHSCTPIREDWKLVLRSLSGWPCCLGCTKGEYDIVITG